MNIWALVWFVLAGLAFVVALLGSIFSVSDVDTQFYGIQGMLCLILGNQEAGK